MKYLRERKFRGIKSARVVYGEKQMKTSVVANPLETVPENMHRSAKLDHLKSDFFKVICHLVGSQISSWS